MACEQRNLSKRRRKEKQKVNNELGAEGINSPEEWELE